MSRSISVFLFLHRSVNDVSCKWNRGGYWISRSILPVLWIRQFHFTLCKLLLLMITQLNVYVFVHLKFVLCCTKFSDSKCKVVVVRSVITKLVKCGIQISHEKTHGFSADNRVVRCHYTGTSFVFTTQTQDNDSLCFLICMRAQE